MLREEWIKWMVCVGGLSLSFFLSACDTTPHFAPVTDISNMDPIPKTGVHRVVQGETLYSIAWRYGLDYRIVAAQNHIAPPYAIRPGELIRLQTLKRALVLSEPLPEHVQTRSLGIPVKMLATKSPSPSGWLMPAKGKIIATQKGINIKGQLGESVYAAARGKVVYAGNGLRGYGNLIIIKHNSLYLSAYAHNRVMFVREGEIVKIGQKISEMGNSGTNQIMLHFEIRKAGKPINPLPLLQS